ncbi:MAG: hypothetical protein ACREM8_06305 [Vulcanimicrobiaceae bacterium]
MLETIAPIEELLRLPSPAPAPQSLSCDGAMLWMGSRDSSRVYAIESHTGKVREESQAPGIPWGMVVMGDELRVTCGEGADDDRYIRRFVPGHGFKSSERIACPDFTGSFLGYDGESLFLSQYHNKRIFKLDAAGKVQRTIPIEREIAGFVFVDGKIYVLRGDTDSCDWRLARLDPNAESPVIEDLAAIPFQGRSLGYDGSRFWTNDRDANTIVAFAKP